MTEHWSLERGLRACPAGAASLECNRRLASSMISSSGKGGRRSEGMLEKLFEGADKKLQQLHGRAHWIRGDVSGLKSALSSLTTVHARNIG